MFLVQFLPKLRTTTLTTTHFAAATAAPFPQFLRSLSTTATPTTTTTTSPPSPVHRSNSPLTVGRKTFRKRHQKRYKRRARQTQLNDKVVKQQKKTPSPVAMRKGFNGGVKRHSTKQDCCLTITTKTNKKARFVVVKQQAMVKLRIQTKTPLQTELAKWCLCNAPETICLLKNPKQKSKTNKKKEDQVTGLPLYISSWYPGNR